MKGTIFSVPILLNFQILMVSQKALEVIPTKREGSFNCIKERFLPAEALAKAGRNDKKRMFLTLCECIKIYDYYKILYSR